MYKWKRYWCPRGGFINLGNQGFLSDPESKSNFWVNSDLVPLESKLEIPCLILLGEPGIGKSTTLSDAKSSIEKYIYAKGDQLIWIDLKSFGSEDRLIMSLFESNEFKEWLTSNKRLNIFLDSFDECLLRIETLGAIIKDGITNIPIERLSLRIACRTADWLTSLESDFKMVWGENNVCIFELAPLRRQDVSIAASTFGCDAELFIKEVIGRELVPFAIKPITLNFLLGDFKKNGCLPQQQKDLYYHGCLLLCEETNISRKGSLSPYERFYISSKIAALSRFCKRNAIWTGRLSGELDATDLFVEEICQGNIKIDEKELLLNESLIKEVLNTGLFSSRGIDRLGWAHETYAEYLAAFYLFINNVSLPQIENIFLHPYDPEDKFIPQLSETAAWLAGMRIDFFDKIAEVEPELLLRSDTATNNNSRKQLTEVLLKNIAEENFRYWNLSQIELKKLRHPELKSQLQDYLKPTYAIHVRYTVIDIIEACEIKDLETDLLNIAIDEKEAVELRTNAVNAISRISGNEIKNGLRKILENKLEEDINDELRSSCLKALWPDIINSELLFQFLTPPKKDNYVGLYDMFMCYEIPEKFKLKDLPNALNWVSKQIDRYRMKHTQVELVNFIINMGWENLDDNKYVTELAKATYSRLKHYENILHEENSRKRIYTREQFIKEKEKRRKVVEALIPLISDVSKDIVHICQSNPPLIVGDDIPWLIDKLVVCKSEKEKQIYSKFISHTFRFDDNINKEIILETCLKEPLLKLELRWAVGPVELDSKEANDLRNYHAEMITMQRQSEAKLLDPPPKERVLKTIDQCENGNINMWCQLIRDLSLEPHDVYYHDDYNTDLTGYIGWKEAEQTTRERIVSIAKKYIIEAQNSDNKWINTNSYLISDLSAYKSIRLLFKVERNQFELLPNDIWIKWAPIIIGYPIDSGFEKDEIDIELVKIAYQHSPDNVIDTLLSLIDKENKAGDYIFITRRIEKCWDNNIANKIFEKAKDITLKPSCRKCLLETLLHHNYSDAKVYIKSLISTPLVSNEEDKKMWFNACVLLFTRTIDNGWDLLWPIIQNNTDFGKDLFLTIGNIYNSHDANIVGKQTEQRLADLFIWMEKQFPYNEDPKFEDGHCVSAREDVGHWRNSILNILRNRGTLESVMQLNRLKEELPHLNFLKWTLFDAKEETRRKTWTPISPKDFIKLTTSAKYRIIHSSDQLLEVVLTLLGDIEKKLHGPQNPIQFLWDRQHNGKFRPKEEDSLSDYLYLQLENDLKNNGIIINREVQIRRGIGRTKGQITDIYIDTIDRSTDRNINERISIVLEVKGCWNKELLTAMETQLASRYLINNHCQCGLYIVGWYGNDVWDGEDKRKKDVPDISIHDLQTKLDEQARELSITNKQVKAFVMNLSLG